MQTLTHLHVSKSVACVEVLQQLQEHVVAGLCIQSQLVSKTLSSSCAGIAAASDICVSG